MSYIKAFEFEVDPDKVELRFTDGTVLTIDRTAVESGFTNPYELGDAGRTGEHRSALLCESCAGQ